MNSNVCPPGREIDVARCLEAALSSAGIAVELDEFAPGRANVLARLPGAGLKPPLVFSAHLDTVPVGATGWTVEPFGGQIIDGRLYGRGASDMKSGVVAMTAAFLDIAASKRVLGGDLLLAFSAGESSNCLGAKRFVERAMFADAGAILVSEPSSLNLIIAEMGVLWLRATAWGRAGHISGDPGISAIDKMAAFVMDLPAIALPCPDYPRLPAPTLRVGTIRGGSAVNVTPDQCSVEIDVRLRPGTTPEEIVHLLASSGLTVDILDFKPSVETADDHPFTRACFDSCAIESPCEPTVSGVAYYSDATIYTAAYGTPFAIVGPGELGMSGQPDEFVEVEKLHRAIRIFRRIAEKWLTP
ncbi:M20 family metallopeptidase [Neorhizobium galegae]|uniref:M20 family metallopeptidase n=1 Tax=Neorhizobium galegae TaxID=399 RepID=UPI000620FE47|nr:M20 family metallopeptidase [Neorhizobium galegae]KAB1125562.1 M20 family metallopeptidase [Neorhizobium galegae]MCQ1805819.1 M20 family metallopeptidase [Neorhizobium galegae]CDZ59621.1 Acetylornithine deacetylase or succinyl-diaminopimelate desuccinylase [Neorhizobium galegae bv. orientalis]